MSRIMTTAVFALVAAAGFSGHAAVISNVFSQYGLARAALRQKYAVVWARLLGAKDDCRH